jgi:hypothetical protein
MNNFYAMSDDELIICVNLLRDDARHYEQMSDNQEQDAVLQECANDRRALAARMKAEIDRRRALRRGRAA